MKKLVMTALAATMISTAASADSITLVCDPTVSRGTIKLTNPLSINCEDFKLAKSTLGSGITLGPDSNVNRIIADLRSIPKERFSMAINEDESETLTRNENGSETFRNVGPNKESIYKRSWIDVNREEQSVWNDIERKRKQSFNEKFDKKNFPGLRRNREWFEVYEPHISNTVKCEGWTNLNDIISGKCGEVKIKMNGDGGTPWPSRKRRVSSAKW